MTQLQGLPSTDAVFEKRQYGPGHLGMFLIAEPSSSIAIVILWCPMLCIFQYRGQSMPKSKV